MKKILGLLLTVAFVSFLPSAGLAKNLTLDKTHSNVRFQVRHFFTQMEGRFDQFNATFSFDPKNIKATKLSASVDIASVNTNNKKRDRHLISSDFFDGKKFPKMTFKSTGVGAIKGKTFDLKGKLTIRGTSKEVVMKVRYLGVMKDRRGGLHYGFSATTKINRTHYKVGGRSMVIGSDVTIKLNIAMKGR